MLISFKSIFILNEGIGNIAPTNNKYVQGPPFCSSSICKIFDWKECIYVLGYIMFHYIYITYCELVILLD